MTAIKKDKPFEINDKLNKFGGLMLDILGMYGYEVKGGLAFPREMLTEKEDKVD